jgi:hypothetical protein
MLVVVVVVEVAAINIPMWQQLDFFLSHCFIYRLLLLEGRAVYRALVNTSYGSDDLTSDLKNVMHLLKISIHPPRRSRKRRRLVSHIEHNTADPLQSVN